VITWDELKQYVSAGNLDFPKRSEQMRKRYHVWAADIRNQYGSMVNYLRSYRLQWGQPDRLSLIPSLLDSQVGQSRDASANAQIIIDTPEYFLANIPAPLISIIQSDWPYALPSDVEHTVIWSQVPILPPTNLVPDHIASRMHPKTVSRVRERLAQDGVWGFTGSSSRPSNPSFGQGPLDDSSAMLAIGKEVATFVRRRWVDSEWETVWIVNPPRLQSVPGLAHIHVFARRKSRN